MNEYTVVLPMTGTLYTTVEAESEEEAIEKAWQTWRESSGQAWTIFQGEKKK